MAPAPARVSKIYRGWWMAAVSVAGLTFSVGTMLAYTFGIFAKPLAAELHASRASIALAVSFVDIILTFASPGAGRLADRYGARGVIVTSLIALCACLVGLAYLQPPLWHLYALYGAAGLLGVATTPVTYSRVISNWFDKHRGLALGIANAGIGVGAFITPSLAQYLLDRGGLRLAYLGMAGCCLLTALPVVWIFLRTKPEECGLHIDNLPAPPPRTEKSADGMTVSEAFRTPTFWLLCFIFFCVAACVNGAVAHIGPMLTDSGVSPRSAALAASIFGGMTIVGRVINGYLVDRFFAPRVIAILFTGGAIAVLLMWLAPASSVFLAPALFGLAGGAEGDVMPFLISRYFGMRSMAELFGCAFGVYTMGNAVARYLFGVGFDRYGSYNVPLMCALAAICLAVVACFGLGRYRQSGMA